MEKTRQHFRQYSLAALMAAVAVAAIICRLAGLIGVSAMLAIAPIVWVFWLIYRLTDQMIKTDNRNSNSRQSNYPTRTPYG
jgi:fatty acid desaturase